MQAAMWWRLVVLVMCLLALAGADKATAPQLERVPSGEAVSLKARGTSGSALSAMLEALYEQFAVPRARGTETGFTKDQLRDLFGVDAAASAPMVSVMLRVVPGRPLAGLEAAGAAILTQRGDLVFARVPVHRLRQLGLDPAVQSVDPVPSMWLPGPRPTPPMSPSPPKAREVQFDRQGLSGKGVIVAVIDSGIDWRHPDFANPDGSSRILCLYDMTDQSFADSRGRIGSRPPFTFDGGDTPAGTLYTREQINAALRDAGTVRSIDRSGHGTAVTGVAAGNGRATGKWEGIAPAADLVVVKTDWSNDHIPATLDWVVRFAQGRGQPCVINGSFGSHYSAHDGTQPDEQLIDRVSGAGRPGLVICIACGNEARANIHAAGRFGPRRPGQLDVAAETIELFVYRDAMLTALFNSRDHWGFGLAGLEKALVDAQGQSQTVYVYSDGKDVLTQGSSNLPAAVREAFVRARVVVEPSAGGHDRLHVALPPGRYLVWGFGSDENVADGAFSLYLPTETGAAFGRGTVKKQMVTSPGNARNAITVASYDFRATWTDSQGNAAGCNLDLGGISDYSSPGFRRDGLVKPDIAAPGTFAVSALAPGSQMGDPAAFVVDGGRHVAWSGTSAACPYVAGLVALMLEKNPDLDAEQVRAILKETAIQDDQTGATPNIWWGYGKLNPAAALAKTPPGRRDQFNQALWANRVRVTLLTLNAALQAKDFTAFHQTLSSDFARRWSPQRLKESFQQFIDTQVDLSGIRNHDPVFEVKESSADTMHLEGRFPTKPNNVKFKLWFVQEEGVWRLSAFWVSVSPDR